MAVIIVADTNFLTVPAQFNIDIFDEAERILETRTEFVVLESVAKEIQSKLEQAMSKSEYSWFRIANQLLERCSTVPVPDDLRFLPVDDQILEYASRLRAVIATNDKLLRRKARNRSIPVLLVRKRKHLGLEGTVI